MLKVIIKRILVFIFAKDISKLVIPSEKKVVSFDLFDTLIVRKCGLPDNIFEIVDSRFVEDKRIAKGEFVKARKKAYLAAKKKSRGYDVTIDDIYGEMSDLSIDDLSDFKHTELEMEYENCIPNAQVINVFNEIVANGLDTIIVSDMYLPKVFLERVLKKCGISGYKKIYVSCEEKKTKKKGDLFDYVIENCDIKTKEIIHVGDNPVGDYLIPKSKDIEAFCVKSRGKINIFNVG
jgi:predicted HAD superfamily hydrolase